MEKIAISIGTRPEIIRMAPVIHELESRGIPFYLIHTGQHYDFNMNGIFLEELGIPKPDLNFNYHGKTEIRQIGSIMNFLEKNLGKERPSLLLVQGDTSSVLASGLAGTKLRIPIGHVEAGNRSVDKMMPEEHNRRLVDHLSSILFAQSSLCAKQLFDEGIERERIFITGNTVIDACMNYSKKIGRGLENKYSDKPYVLVTLHRSEMVEVKENLVNFLKVLKEIPKEYNIVFPVHPRTQKALAKFNLLESYKKLNNLKMLPPLGYLEFLGLLKNSEIIVTDSGGVLKEASAFKVPVIIYNTDWPDKEGRDVFWFLSGMKYETTAKLLHGIIGTGYKKMLETRVSPFGDGKAAKRIVDLSNKFVNNELDLKPPSHYTEIYGQV